MIVVVAIAPVLAAVLINLAISLVLTGVALALSRRNDREQLEQRIEFPTSTLGAAVPIVYGRTRIRNPNVLWYGNQEVATVRLSSPRREVRQYTISVALDLCLISPGSVAPQLHRVWSGENTVRFGAGVAAVDAGAVVNIDAQDEYGGLGEGGGLLGTFSFFGTADATINPGIQVTLSDTNAEAVQYRSQCWVVWVGRVGESPNVRPFSFEVEVQPPTLGFGPVSASGDANPAEVLYDLLTSDWGRLGVDPVSIDLASFTAAASTLNTEVHGFSYQISQATPFESVLTTILRQIDGILYEEPTTGLITLKLFREDFSIPSLPLFDTSNVIRLENYRANTIENAPNQVRVTFTSRSENYNPVSVLVHDAANIEATKSTRTAEFQFPGVSDATLALTIATRELGLLALPLTSVRMIANREAATLRPGDVIRLAWPDFNITQIVMRVVSVDLGTLENGQVTVDLLQDRFGFSATIFGDQPPVGIPVTPAPAPVTEQRVLEVPRFLSLKGEEDGLFSTPELQRLQYLAVAPTTNSVSFTSQLSTDGGTNYDTERTDMPFAAVATLSSAYPITRAEVDVAFGLVITNMTDPSVLQSATQAEVENEGKNLVLVGDELFAYLDFLDLGGGSYRLRPLWRGVLDTSPRSHAANDRVYFLDRFQDNIGVTPFAAGVTGVRSRLLPFNGFGVVPPGTATVVGPFDIQNRIFRSYPPDFLRFNGTSHPTLINGLNVNLTWLQRDRLRDTLTIPNGPTQLPTEITTYVIRVSTDGGANFTETTLGMDISNAVFNFPTGNTVTMELVSQRDPAGSRCLFPVTRTFNTI